MNDGERKPRRLNRAGNIIGTGAIVIFLAWAVIASIKGKPKESMPDPKAPPKTKAIMVGNCAISASTEMITATLHDNGVMALAVRHVKGVDTRGEGAECLEGVIDRIYGLNNGDARSDNDLDPRDPRTVRIGVKYLVPPSVEIK